MEGLPPIAPSMNESGTPYQRGQQGQNSALISSGRLCKVKVESLDDLDVSNPPLNVPVDSWDDVFGSAITSN